MKTLAYQPFDPNNDYLINKQRLMDKYQNDPTVKHWLTTISNDIQVQKSIYEKNIFKIDQWIKSLQPCLNCQGYLQCPLAIKGQQPHLSYNGAFVENRFVQCEYAKSYELNHAFMHNYLLNDYPFLSDYEIKDMRIFAQFGPIGANIVKQLNPFLAQYPLDRGLYLYGGLGTGKTVTAAIVANAFAKKGYKVVLINIVSFIESLKRCFDSKDSQAISNKLYELKRTDLLIIDDIGCENNSAWSRDDVLFNVLNYRMEHNKATWFTSNLDFDALRKHFTFNSNASEEAVKAARLMERIETLTSPLLFQGFNIRHK